MVQLKMKQMKTNLYLIVILASGLSMLINSCSKPQPTGGVFVLGGIHQSHEKANSNTIFFLNITNTNLLQNLKMKGIITLLIIS